MVLPRRGIIRLRSREAEFPMIGAIQNDPTGSGMLSLGDERSVDQEGQEPRKGNTTRNGLGAEGLDSQGRKPKSTL